MASVGKLRLISAFDSASSKIFHKTADVREYSWHASSGEEVPIRPGTVGKLFAVAVMPVHCQ